MKKIMIVFLMIVVSLLGCEEEETWVEIESKEDYQEIIQFIYNYKNAWEESLTNQPYSIMESYFVPNSQIFHMVRNQHQHLRSGRKVEIFKEATDIVIEENQYGEFRLLWKETVEIDELGNVIEDIRRREYRISKGSAGYRITAIKRSNEIE